MCSPRCVIVSGPRGSGKSTLLTALRLVFPHVRRMVSHTTRSPRPGETNGIEYHFVTPATFEEMRRDDAFLFERSLGPSQSSGIARSELLLSEKSIIDINGPIARLLRDVITHTMHGKVFAIYLYASPDIRLQRISKRERLTETQARCLMAQDLDDGTVAKYQDFDLCLENNLARKAEIGTLLDNVVPLVQEFFAR